MPELRHITGARVHRPRNWAEPAHPTTPALSSTTPTKDKSPSPAYGEIKTKP